MGDTPGPLGCRMAAIKPIEQSAQKYSRRASSAGPEYLLGVQQPRVAWQSAAIAAGQTYRTAVTQAAGRGAYEAGVRQAGDARWQNGAVRKGPGRFAEGVQLAEGDWLSGFQPYQSSIASVQLPARQARGTAANNQRSVAIQTALAELRRRRLGGTTGA